MFKSSIKCIAAAMLLTTTSSFATTINFYNWSEYIPAGLLAKFTEETGIKVIYSTYESNESMYAKLKTHKENGYDLVVPSTYFISKMKKEGMLQKIDKSKLHNFSNLEPALLNKNYDPNNNFSVPYIWGSTGIGVNTSSVDLSKVHSWQDLWDPKWKGQLLLTDDAREIFHMALKIQGHSANTQDEKELAQAYELLKKLMPNVLVFNSDTPANPYIAGEVEFGMIWNGSAYMAQQEDSDITMVYPSEGAVFWMDSLAIPANAKNIDAVHKLIDFLLRPDVAAEVALEIGYPTPNKAAKKLLPKSFTENKMIFPDAETIEKGEFHSDVGDANVIYERYFEKLKAQNI
jgi:spermidine/putrescine transport system substrate-binding protein